MTGLPLEICCPLKLQLAPAAGAQDAAVNDPDKTPSVQDLIWETQVCPNGTEEVWKAVIGLEPLAMLVPLKLQDAAGVTAQVGTAFAGLKTPFEHFTVIAYDEHDWLNATEETEKAVTLVSLAMLDP